MSSDGPSLLLREALRLHRRGYMPVEVPAGQKGPVTDGWQLRIYTAEELPATFNGVGNIGVNLGKPSGGLVDVDLDCDEAVLLQDQFLPPTPVITGRAKRPRTHRWYIVEGAATRQLRDPVTRKMIVELRSTGAQTLVGPSVHPDDGDVYDRLEGEPAVVPAALLTACVKALADAVIKRRHGKAPAKPTMKAQVATGAEPDDLLLRRAIAYLRAMPPAISGQGGHAQTYAAATAMVHGFGLDTETAFELLRSHYNPRCGPRWSDKELRHKIEDAATKPHELPHGWLRDAKGPGTTGAPVAASDGTGTPPRSHGPEPGTDTELDGAWIRLGDRDPDTGRLVLSAKRTLPTAEAYVAQFHNHPEGRTIHCYAGLLLVWRDNRFVEIEDEAVRHLLQPWLHKALRCVPDGRGGLKLVPFDSNPTTVKSALETVRAYTHIPADTPTPCWLGQSTGQPPPLEILPCRSMNLHVPTGLVLPMTPALFTRNSLEFDYEPNPDPPDSWIRFLECLWGDDLESVALLQEWMGYCLITDTSLQKMLLLVGPRRSGKGTIARVLTRLVGAANVVGPTTGSLAGPFGLQPLIGKSLAIVSDARFHGENTPTVVERLLCISGEDYLTIDRKFLGAVTMKLPTRFMFLSNELPRLADASAALAGRFLVLRLTKSFYGREDSELTNKLLVELPGILRWALDGLKRLRARGRFVQPTSVEAAVQELEELASPVLAFVRERCEVGPGHRATVDDLYAGWRRWCEQEGRGLVSSKQSFGRDLSTAVPGLLRRRGTGDVPFYEGISFKDKLL